MKNKADYLNYVHAVLETVRETDLIPKASYDTGYGLHIVDADLGGECHILDVHASSLGKILPPEIDDFKEWEDAWRAGKDLVHRFIERYKTMAVESVLEINVGSCNHEMIEYTGLSESFKYCKKCDHKE